MNPFRECLGRSSQPIQLPPDDDDEQALQQDDTNGRSHRNCGLWALTALLPRRSHGIQLVDDADPSSSHARTLDDYLDPNTTVGIEPLLDHHSVAVDDDEDDGREFMRKDVFDTPGRFLSRNPFATTSTYYDDDAQFLTDHRISAAVLKQQDIKNENNNDSSGSSGSNDNAPGSAGTAGPEKPTMDFELGQELSDVMTYNRAEPYKGDWTEMDQEESEVDEDLANMHSEHQLEQPPIRQETSFPIVGLPRTHITSAGMEDLIIKSEATGVEHKLVKTPPSEPIVRQQEESVLEEPLVASVEPEEPLVVVQPEEQLVVTAQQEDPLCSTSLSPPLKPTPSDPLSSNESQKPVAVADVGTIATTLSTPEPLKSIESTMETTTTTMTSVKEQEQVRSQPIEAEHVPETDIEADAAGKRTSVAAVAQSILGDRLDDFTEKLAFIKKNIIMSLEDDDEDGWDERTSKPTTQQQQQQQQQQQEKQKQRRVSLDPLMSSQETTNTPQVRHKRSSSLMDMAGPSIARFIHQMSGDDKSPTFSPSSFFASLAGPGPDMTPTSAESQPASPLPQQEHSNSTGTRQQWNQNHRSPSARPPVVPEEDEDQENVDEEELFDFGKMLSMGRTMFSDVANRVRNANHPGNGDNDTSDGWMLDRDNWI